MPEHFAFYSSAYERLPEGNMRLLAGSAEFSIEEAEDGGRQFIYRWPNLDIVCSEMPVQQVPHHLQGFAGWVTRIYQAVPDARGKRLLGRIRDLRLVVGVVVEPERDEHGIAHQFLGTLSTGLDALMLHGSALYDRNGRLLLAPDGRFDEESKIGDASDDRVKAEVELPKDRPVFQATPAQDARFQRVLTHLQQRKVPTLSYALHIDDEEHAILRTPTEVVERVLVLSAVTLLADGGSREDALKLIESRELWPAVSPRERAFLEASETNLDQACNLLWRLECLWVLMWALGDLSELDWPGQMCDVPRLVAQLRNRETASSAEARLRDKTAILDAQQETLLLHWAVRDAWIHRRSIPQDLDWEGTAPLVTVEHCPAVGVVEQRHYALNWLTRFGDAEWDDVETPT